MKPGEEVTSMLAHALEAEVFYIGEELADDEERLADSQEELEALQRHVSAPMRMPTSGIHEINCGAMGKVTVHVG